MSDSKKINFISDLLAHKKITVAEKERLFTLTKEEIKKINFTTEEANEQTKIIIKRLNAVEKNIIKQLCGNPEEISSTEKQKFHKPIETKEFLSLFNNSEGLKYLTHKFSADKPDYDIFIDLCKKEFEQGKKKYPNVPGSIIRRIEEFAFRNSPKWYIRKGNDKIYPHHGWMEPSFVEWYQQSNNKNHPASDAKWNKEMIIPFKETIEVREPNLLNIVNDAIELAEINSNSFNINKNNPNNWDSLKQAVFYTDVDKLQYTLFLIFSLIKEWASKEFHFDIEVKYENEQINDGIFKNLIITHIDSQTPKNSNDPEFAKGDMKSIINNLYGLCNYEIMAKFADGYKKRVFLTDNLTEFYEKVNLSNSISVQENTVKGFTHILKFY